MFSRLIKFLSLQGDRHYFADLGAGAGLPILGATLTAYATLDNLFARVSPVQVERGKLLLPFPHSRTLVLCAQFDGFGTTPSYRDIKPVARLSEIHDVNVVQLPCFDPVLDYEAGLVFVTTKECRDVSSAQAKEYILGYACGFRICDVASIGPMILHPSLADLTMGLTTTLKINEDLHNDPVAAGAIMTYPESILAHASIDRTIPAGTAFMLHPVGYSDTPRLPLQDGDMVKVEIEGIGTLRSQISLVNDDSVRIHSTEFRGSDRACVPS